MDNLEQNNQAIKASEPDIKAETVILPEKLLELINSDKELDIEIGFGKGRFLIEKAKLFPEINFIGYEIRTKHVKKVNRAIERFQIENLYVEKSAANQSIPIQIPEGRVRYLYINFPDPWWKRKHKKRRILQDQFVSLFHKILHIGGRVYVRTDVKDYADDVLKIFSASPDFKSVEHDIISDGIMTNREHNCSEEGLDIYRVAFEKIR